MERKKKHTGRKIVLGLLVTALAAGLVAAPFILERRSRASEIRASVLSATATIGNITKTLSGTGTLTEEDAVTVTVPEGVEITEYYVSNGDPVQEGQPVAAVDKTSVMRAISAVNDTLSELSSRIEDAAGTLADQYVTARSAGRLKAVYASVGDNVRDVVTRYGALAVVSLDGRMAVDIPAGGISVSSTVSVRLSDGTTVPGTVYSISDGTAVVTIDDLYGEIDESVSVFDGDGNVLGEGSLYIHSPWKAIAYTGTVAGKYLKAGKKVWTGANLFRLTDTEDTAEYDLLTEQRREYEDIAYELFLLYQDGVVKAPCEGRVSGADDSLLKQLSAQNGGYTLMLLAANTPDGNDATVFRNRVGVITEISENDGTVKASLLAFDTQIDDYADLSGLYLNTESMTMEVTILPSVAVYSDPVRNDDGSVTWTQSWGNVSRGDLYVFAYDSDLAWMIYAGHVDLPEPTPSPTPAPTPTPAAPQPSASPGAQSGAPSGAPSGPTGGGTGGVGGAVPKKEEEEEEETLFSTSGTAILSVTPQDIMTVTITVDELDILSVQMGQEVGVTVDALPGQSFKGDITSIDTTATNEGGNTKYAVEITLDRTEKMLGGMNASAKITLQTKENILTIPTDALSEEETGTVVYTGYDAASETLLSPAGVETGLSDGLRTEILSGLSEGDTIWYFYYDTLEISGLPNGFTG